MKFVNCMNCDFKIEQIFAVEHQPHCAMCEMGKSKPSKWKKIENR
jgi:hypothetical protein